MVTYADLVQLILVFFVLLYSFSSTDVQTFRTVMAAIQGSLGVLDRGRAVDPISPLDRGALQLEGPIAHVEPSAQMRRLMEELEQFVQSQGLEGQLELEMQERGVAIRFADQVLFDLGRADLKPEAREILDRLAEPLSQVPNHIRIEGHTDNWPIRTAQYPSNWELSTARATRVLRYLIETKGLEPSRFSAAGYGEYRPLVPNDTAANRARNRRVDIILLRTDIYSGESWGTFPDGAYPDGEDDR